MGYFTLYHIVFRVDANRNRIVGDCLRNMRVETGLTQMQLSERLGKDQSYVSKIETGERSLHLHELFDYAHALEIPLDEITSTIGKRLEKRS